MFGFTQDAVLVAALVCSAAARSAFGATVQRLMERWQEGGDAGENVNQGKFRSRIISSGIIP